MCDACLGTIETITGPTCATCGGPCDAVAKAPRSVTVCWSCQHAGKDLPRTRTAATLDGTIREAIHALKYRDRPDVARPLARLLVAPAVAVTNGVAPVVVPVALHPRRLDARGYDQSRLLAAHLARDCGWTIMDAIARIRETDSQVGLGRAARRANVAGAFRCTARLDGVHVLLVDDVMTTGATLVEAARACRAVGAATVAATCLAREVFATSLLP
jgi:ComF family protein